MQKYTPKRRKTPKKQTMFPWPHSLGREGAEFQPSTFGEHTGSEKSTWAPKAEKEK